MRKVLVALLLFNLFACNSGDNVPAEIIKPAQMQNIFWDLLRGEQLAQEIVKEDSSQNIKRASFAITENIFVIHHIDRNQFEKSIAFYEKHPALMKTMFDSLSAIHSRKKFQIPETKTRPFKDYHLPKHQEK